MQVFILFALVGIVFLIGYIVTTSDKKPEAEHREEKTAEHSGIKSTISGVDIPKPEPPRPVNKKKPQKSSDAIYAETHNMWVCKHCETLNSFVAQNCIACGTKKSA